MSKIRSILSLLLLASLLSDPLIRAATSSNDADLAPDEAAMKSGTPLVVSPAVAVAMGSAVPQSPWIFGIQNREVWPAALRPMFRAQPKASKIVWNLRQALHRASVILERGKQRTDCDSFDGVRFRCGDRPHEYVGTHAGAFRRFEAACVWMHPHRDEQLILRLPGLPKFDEITGFVGLMDESRKRARVDISILVGGRTVHQKNLDRDNGPHLITAKAPKGTQSDLEIRVKTRDPHRRLLCLDLYGVMRGRR